MFLNSLRWIFLSLRHTKCPADVIVYLFVVQQTISGGEAEMIGIELRGLMLVVELETGRGQPGL